MDVRPKQVLTLLGKVSYCCPYYQCQLETAEDEAGTCRHGEAPADALWSLVGRRSIPGVQQAVRSLAAQGMLEEAAESFSRLLPLQMSARQALTRLQPVGEALAAQEDAQVQRLFQQAAQARTQAADELPSLEEEPERLSIEMDGVTARLRGGSVPMEEKEQWRAGDVYREVKVGAVFAASQGPERSGLAPGVFVDEAGQKHYVAGRCPSEDFGKLLYALATQAGLAGARQVVCRFLARAPEAPFNRQSRQMGPGFDRQAESKPLFSPPEQAHEHSAAAIETPENSFGLGFAARRAGSRFGLVLSGFGVASGNMVQRQMLQGGKRLVRFALGSDSHRQQRGQGQPEPFHPFGLLAATALPVPAASFAILDSTCNPGPPSIPARFGLCNWQISQDEPGVLIALFPARQQRAPEARPFAGKAAHPPAPLRAYAWHQSHDRLKGRPPFGRLGSRFTPDMDAQERMPLILHDPLGEPRGIQPAVGHHQHLPVGGNGLMQQFEQV